ncbi:MAG TPA: N-acetylmuramoyl-L-alanine amidase [Kofleriaceae bacterium]|nr:N-acetylmuramoyl-L-alanine amidase [Kofleriaceae bacterium]
MTRSKWLTSGAHAAVLALALAGCGSSGTGEDGADDHAIDLRTFEGDQLTALFGADGVSAPLAFDGGFRRVGLLWDDTADGAIEVRTSTDGLTWTDWAAPQVVSAEEIAHAGHVDAIAVGADGSTDADPIAGVVQLRVAAGKPRPTFLVLEPLADIPPAVDPQQFVLDTIDAGDHPDGEDAGSGLFSSVESSPIGGLRIYSRADWGARAPRCAGGSMTPNRATIHHTVTPTNDSLSPQARLRQIQSFHMFTNGWCDIGYNYIVSRDGRVWRGRGARTVGAHVTNNNTGNVGISFLGTYTSTAPTSTQMCSAAKLLRILHDDYPALSLTRSDIKGHRQYGGTECPGNVLYGKISTIISKAIHGC